MRTCIEFVRTCIGFVRQCLHVCLCVRACVRLITSAKGDFITSQATSSRAEHVLVRIRETERVLVLYPC